MALSVLSLLRERMPCSENYWRFRRNFEQAQSLSQSNNSGLMGAATVDNF